MLKNSGFLLIKVIESFLFIFLAAIVMLVLVQIVSRYVTRLPFRGIEELARLLFVWACFLGAALCTLKDRHIKAEIFKNKLPIKINNCISVIIYIMLIVVSSVMIITGSQFTVSRWVYPDSGCFPELLFVYASGRAGRPTATAHTG